ncbi:unnamed protein product [Fraxinus pennsylvanica]|uniref:nucleoside-diphosphate kinase n=1 Tax=Fraxinus pennsylvanica TaxID=56036 RepID=A0AAD2DUR8_9LAMI|nr:unnamed protein product [Fraxinus pennsylvanica]
MDKGLNHLTVDCPFIEKHYADLSAKPFFNKLVDYIILDFFVGMAWKGKNAVITTKKIFGDVSSAEFSIVIMPLTLTFMSAKNEIAIWFPEGIAKWKSSIHSWINE